MSRQDKILSFVLGAALFSGLFYFLYTTWKSAPAAYAGGAAAEDMTAAEDNNFEDTMAAGEPVVQEDTSTVKAPAAPPAVPVEKK